MWIRRKLGAKMIILVVGTIVILMQVVGIVTMRFMRGIFLDNLKQTCEMTLEDSMRGLNEYEKTLSLPVDLLTRKNEVRKLNVEDEDAKYSFEDRMEQVKDTLVASVKVTEGARKAYYVTTEGQRIEGWIEYKEDGSKASVNEVYENVDESKEEWYQNAIGRKASMNAIFSYISQPYLDEKTNERVFTVSQEVKTSDVLVGIAAMDINIKQLEEYVQETKMLNTGFVLLTDEDGNILVDNDKNGFLKDSVASMGCWPELDSELDEKAAELETALEAQSEEADEIRLIASKIEEVGKSRFVVTVMQDRVTGWRMVGFIGENENEASMGRIRMITMVFATIGSIIGGILVVLFLIPVIRGIKSVQSATKLVAAGDFTQEIKVTSKDEIGQLQENFNEMIESVSEMMHAVQNQSNCILDVSAEITEMAQNTKMTLGQVSEAIGHVAQGASNQAASTQEAGQKVEKLSESLEDTKDHVATLEEIKQDANALSVDGLKSVKKLTEKSRETRQKGKISIDAVGEMADSINKIYYISDAIADITDQTNLLSLNASIEAARAGEAGKGFAVVADEIRQLADESRKSTDEIKKIVAEITEKSQLAQKVMGESEELQLEQQKAIELTKDLFAQLLKLIERIGNSVEEILQGNKLMAEHKDDVVERMEQISNISEQSAAATEQVNASASEINNAMEEVTDYTEELSKIALELKQTIERFRLE